MICGYLSPSDVKFALKDLILEELDVALVTVILGIVLVHTERL